MSKRRSRHGAVAALAAALLFCARPARADADGALGDAAKRVSDVKRGIAAVERVSAGHTSSQHPPQRRLAEAVLLLGVKDYERATDLLNQVIEKYPDEPAVYADALSLLGESYFQSEEYLSARRVFNRIIDGRDNPRMARFYEAAAVRSVDIALRLRDFAALEALFAKIGAVTGAQSGLSYARGKGLIAQGKLAAAEVALAGVAADSKYAHQAAYLRGVVATQQAAPAPLAEGEKPAPISPGRYAKAIGLFREVTKLAADTPQRKHIIDMAWLAVARLLYESNQWQQAVASYNRIGRKSPEFGTMLYELAWVYVRLGDVTRAQRALEVLAVAAPNSEDVADAQLLRGDLMLRAGQFDKSRKVYESVRATYEVMSGRLAAFMARTTDPAVYFDTLSRDQLELFDSGDPLPSLVLKWAREGGDGPTAFAIIDDVARSRRLIRESNDMIERLNAVLASPNRIRALPGLRAVAERGIGMLNGVAMARRVLAAGMDDVSDDGANARFEQARQQRRALERRLGMIPVTDADFIARDRQAKRQWNRTSQALQRLELEVDTLQATANGLDRMLRDGPQAGVVRSPQQTQELRQQLTEQKQLINNFRKQIDLLRRATEAGKVQVGFGDKRFVEDAQTRILYKKALWREVKMAQAGEGGSAQAAYAQRLLPILKDADAADARLEAALARIDNTVDDKTAELRQVVRRETTNILNYSLHLSRLDQEARLVVGEVAMQNFNQVRKRLRDIVLRADVGITEEAWEVREEQLTRVRRLKIERARTQARLQEELDEVLDDSGEPEQPETEE